MSDTTTTTAAAGPVLQLRDVHTCYGAIEALKGITVDVNKGEIVTLIGANGAGKSTTLKTISGLLTPSSGDIMFQGQKISGMKVHEVTAKRVVQVPEGRRIFPRMTVEENLEMGAFLRTKEAEAVKASYERVYELFPRLKERRTQKGGTLSGGEQQMLAMGRAMMSRPKLLLLDEPSMGLAPLMVQKVFETVLAVSKEGVTILLIEQNAKLALEVSHRGYVMESGEITLSGESKSLLHDPKVRAAYLGA